MSILSNMVDLQMFLDDSNRAMQASDRGLRADFTQQHSKCAATLSPRSIQAMSKNKFNQERNRLYDEIGTYLTIKISLYIFNKLTYIPRSLNFSKDYTSEIMKAVVDENTTNKSLASARCQMKSQLLQKLKNSTCQGNTFLEKLKYNTSYLYTYTWIHLIFPICYLVVSWTARVLESTVKHYFEKNPTLPIDRVIDEAHTLLSIKVSEIEEKAKGNTKTKIKIEEMPFSPLGNEKKQELHKKALSQFYTYSTSQLATTIVKTLDLLLCRNGYHASYNIANVALKTLKPALKSGNQDKAGTVLKGIRSLLLTQFATFHKGAQAQPTSQSAASRIEQEGYSKRRDGITQDTIYKSLMLMHYLISLDGDVEAIKGCTNSSSFYRPSLKLLGLDLFPFDEKHNHNLKELYALLSKHIGSEMTKFMYNNVVHDSSNNYSLKLGLLNQALEAVKAQSQNTTSPTQSKTEVEEDVSKLAQFILEDQIDDYTRSLTQDNKQGWGARLKQQTTKQVLCSFKEKITEIGTKKTSNFVSLLEKSLSLWAN